ncbi:MAG: DUF3096 domain-containing protein [Gammaproteobacteria bacterium]
MESFAFHPTFSVSTLEALIALVAGIWILVMPRVLNYVVAIYLIAKGGLGLLMTLRAHYITLPPLIALVSGILILVRPALLNYVVAFYLIIIGILGLAR